MTRLHALPSPRRWRWGVLSLLVGIGCGGHAEGEEEVQAVVGARTALAQEQPFTETIGAIGSVVPRPGRVAALAAPAPGRVADVLVTVGQPVAEGAPLVRLEQAPFEAAAQSAEAALAAAERAHERAQRLANDGIAPRKDVDQAAADLARARAELGIARRALELSTLRSPLAGVVTEVSAVLGAGADPSQTLVQVADPSSLDLLFTIAGADAARVRPGARVVVRAGQRATDDTVATGVVADVAGQFDPVSRGVQVRARASGVRGALRIGETVFGEIAVGTRPHAITIPTESLVPEGEGFKVFVVDSAGVAHEREVTVGGRAGGLAEITEGLEAMERVVTYGAYGVEDGAKITPPAAKP